LIAFERVQMTQEIKDVKAAQQNPNVERSPSDR
jgi:hypothetical protein